MRKRWLSAVLIAVILAATGTACVKYLKFVSSKIYDESASHLTEIYSQMNRSFHEMVTVNWNNLRSWAPFLKEVKDEAKVSEYINQQQKISGFTDFYFISENGFFLTVSGNSGYLELNGMLPKLIVNRENIAADSVMPGSSGTMIFAVPCDTGMFRGFEYSAIAVSYNNSDMISLLEISAFGDRSDSYLVYSDGRIIIDNTGLSSRSIYNFIAYLESVSDISGEDIKKLRQDFYSGKFGITTFNINRKSYYLIYEPLEFQDWMVLGVVSADVVNASMNQLRNITMAVIIGIALFIGGVLMAFVVWNSRKRIREKDKEILYREELFATLCENVDNVFFMLDADDLNLSYISPNVRRTLGRSEEQVRSEINGEVQLFLKGDEKANIVHLKDISLGQRMEWDEDYIDPRSGEKRFFRILAYCAQIDGLERYIIVLSDRTEDKKMNQTLKDALEVAKSANEAKSNFLANMSHDIRTPMNAIIGFTTLIGRDAENSDKVREYTRKIAFSGRHLLDIINDILDMSKIESGKTSLNLAEFSLSDMMEEICSIVMPQAKAKNQTLEIHTRGILPEKLLGDKTRMNQILLNLLSNAVKYTQEGGEISMLAERLPQNLRNYVHLRFVVKDNGFGMSDEFIKTIFEPFARETTGRNSEIQGTGLGMAITKNIVDLMGGTISVKSELNKGSTFTVELELSMVDEERTDRFWIRHGITRLLVTDDEEDVCLNIKSLMSETGVNVDYAINGAQAVEMVSSAHSSGRDFNAVILDWEMPGMDGLETVRRICAAVGRYVPILILTAYDFSEIENDAKAAGINMFLPKPFFVSSFRRVISKYYDEEVSGLETDCVRGLHVLAVEDNDINAEILQKLLESEGLFCERAADGREAVERFLSSKTGEFDIILMDVQMPVMNGYEATRLIRSSEHPEAKTVPIIAMTANAFEEDVRKALESGMNAHTSKPINIKRLKELIAEIKKRKS